jgi:F0F1-type ATP synthase assembly protein I
MPTDDRSSDRRLNDQAIGKLTYSIEQLTNDVHEIRTKVEAIEAQANRWKGAFTALLAIGGVIGWFADKIASFVRH